MRLRAHSLFWTFAGSFLVVVVVATVLQAVLIYLVFSPKLSEWITGDARARVGDVVEELERAEPLTDSVIADVLHRHVDDPARLMIVYRRDDGSLVAPRRMPDPMRRRIGRLLSPDSSPRGEAPGRPGPGGLPGRPGPRMRVLATGDVEVGGERVGEVIAFAPGRGLPLVPPGTPLRIVIFLPVAMVVAGAAGLLLFRAFIRRLRRLEALAMRVAEGDLDARVEDPGPDEIGRLGQQLNRMTHHLAAARDTVATGERQRRQLLADVSHELATPLTSIRGYAETLLNPDVPLSADERRHYVENVLEESERIDLLVQDLFDLTRLEAGVIALAPESIELVDLCRRTVDRFQRRFNEAGIECTFESEAGSARLDCDGRRMEQVLDNLLANALRYVPPGGHVRVRLAARNDDGARVVDIAVADNGPGFDADDLPHVFDRFYRGDSARTTAGTGLGLAIVREIVARHGGRVRAANCPDGGAEIVVTLPSAPPT